MITRFKQLAVAGGMALAALGSTACAGTTRAEGTVVFDYPAVYVETVPAYTVYQPRVYYRGRYAYLVDGRWYYPTDRGWVVFREEPRELQRYRVNSGDRVPYDYRYRSTPQYRYRATPEYRYETTPERKYRPSPEYASPPPPPPQEPRYRR